MMTGTNRRAFAAGISLLPLVFAGRSGAQEFAGKLTITGSSTVAPLVLEIGKAFEKLHPKVRIDVQTGGSSRGVADARSGLADIGMASRDLSAAEKTDLSGYSIARDGISLIVHARNRVKELTDQQVVDIFTGRITDWKDAGGAPGRVTVVNKAEGRSTLELFLAYYKLKNSDVKANVVIGDNAQGVKTVVGNPGAVSYVSVGTAEFEVEQKTPIKALAVGGVAPTSENVGNGTFPLSRPLTLATRGAPQGLAKAFIAFAQSKDVHPLVKEQFFVPIGD
jgi:phosphate transport system substrate-binding protein